MLLLEGQLTPLVYRCFVYLVQFGSNWRTLGEPGNNQPFGNQAEGLFCFYKFFTEKEGFLELVSYLTIGGIKS